MNIKELPSPTLQTKYYITDDGRVYTTYRYSDTPSIKHPHSGVVLYEKRVNLRGDYPMVNIAGKRVPIHRLVAEAFLPRVKGKNIVNHKDSDKTNNRADNLEWCTQAENINHSIAKGRTSHQGYRTQLFCTRCNYYPNGRKWCVEPGELYDKYWHQHGKLERRIRITGSNFSTTPVPK